MPTKTAIKLANSHLSKLRPIEELWSAELKTRKKRNPELKLVKKTRELAELRDTISCCEKLLGT